MRARPLRQIHATEALERVRGMRREPSAAEKMLWRHLRNRRLEGAKFRRQYWIGGYIADFVCVECQLIVEADGEQHHEQRAYDQERDATSAASGWRTLRFWNSDIMKDIGDVLEAVRAALHAPSPSHRPADGGPLPLLRGEGF